MEDSIKATFTFTDYVKEGTLYDSFEKFKVLNRVLNPQGANGGQYLKFLVIQKFGIVIILGVLALEMKKKSDLFLMMKSSLQLKIR